MSAPAPKSGSKSQAVSPDPLSAHIQDWPFAQDTKEATRKRIESLKADAPGAARARSSPLKGGRAASAGPEAEARGPKRLSQIKVDPSIAKSIGGLKIPASSVQPKAAQSQSTPAILDLFGDSEPQQQAAAPPAASVSCSP